MKNSHEAATLYEDIKNRTISDCDGRVPILKTLYDQISETTFIYAVLSHVKNKGEQTVRKIDIRPVAIGEEIMAQASLYYEKKVQHENLSFSALAEFLEKWLGPYFRQGVFYTTENDYQVLYSKKGKYTVLKKAPTRVLETVAHNRTKQYIIPEGEPCDFMIHLGVMHEDGRVVKKYYDKFRQLNRYLEFISDHLDLFRRERVRVVDFGCGKAYLTFALYYYLVEQLGLEVDMIGLDLKEDVIEFCNRTAEALNYKDLHFMKGSIERFESEAPIDVVVSLHACDTATDEAIAKAVGWGAKLIFAVPCCQHELFSQLNNSAMAPLLAHGVVKDKLTALVTDTLRQLALEAAGYDVQVLEFIDLEHTPKNILIRARRSEGETKAEQCREAYGRYLDFMHAWSVNPRIDRVMKPYFPNNE